MGSGSHFLAVPRIDVSRHCIRLGKTKRSKAFKTSSKAATRSNKDTIHQLIVSSAKVDVARTILDARIQSSVYAVYAISLPVPPD